LNDWIIQQGMNCSEIWTMREFIVYPEIELKYFLPVLVNFAV